MKLTIVARHYSKSGRILYSLVIVTTAFYSYAVSELKKDVERELLSYPQENRESLRAATQFAVFVVHNKTKAKLADLPTGTR